VGTAPDISGFASLLSAVDVQGPTRFVYSYLHEKEGDVVGAFLRRLRETAPGRLVPYTTAMRMVGLQGRASGEKWHMLDKEKVPKGIAKDAKGQQMSLNGIGEFKNIAHKSRIFHCTDEDGLIVLLTFFEGKKENKLSTEAINPALYARQEYIRRKGELIANGRRR
jgi:hypothetical protein